jgi:hypothetical protein
MTGISASQVKFFFAFGEPVMEDNRRRALLEILFLPTNAVHCVGDLIRRRDATAKGE